MVHDLEIQASSASVVCACLIFVAVAVSPRSRSVRKKGGRTGHQRWYLRARSGVWESLLHYSHDPQNIARPSEGPTPTESLLEAMHTLEDCVHSGSCGVRGCRRLQSHDFPHCSTDFDWQRPPPPPSCRRHRREERVLVNAGHTTSLGRIALQNRDNPMGYYPRPHI